MARDIGYGVGSMDDLARDLRNGARRADIRSCLTRNVGDTTGGVNDLARNRSNHADVRSRLTREIGDGIFSDVRRVDSLTRDLLDWLCHTNVNTYAIENARLHSLSILDAIIRVLIVVRRVYSVNSVMRVLVVEDRLRFLWGGTTVLGGVSGCVIDRSVMSSSLWFLFGWVAIFFSFRPFRNVSTIRRSIHTIERVLVQFTWGRWSDFANGSGKVGKAIIRDLVLVMTIAEEHPSQVGHTRVNLHVWNCIVLKIEDLIIWSGRWGIVVGRWILNGGRVKRLEGSSVASGDKDEYGG